MIPKTLRKVSRLEPKNLVERGLKLCEENGELAAEIFKLLGKKKSQVTKKQTLANLREEAVDCLIMSMDILAHTNTSNRQVKRLFDKKMKKWLDKMENRS